MSLKTRRAAAALRLPNRGVGALFRSTPSQHLPAPPRRGTRRSWPTVRPRRARRGLCSKEPPPPPPTAYRRLRTRREANRGLPGPGHATHSRTLGTARSQRNQRLAALPARTTRAHGQRRWLRTLPRTLPTKPTRLEAAPSTKQRLPKPTPSPRRRDTDHDKRWTARRRPR